MDRLKPEGSEPGFPVCQRTEPMTKDEESDALVFSASNLKSSPSLVQTDCVHTSRLCKRSALQLQAHKIHMKVGFADDTPSQAFLREALLTRAFNRISGPPRPPKAAPHGERPHVVPPTKPMPEPEHGPQPPPPQRPRVLRTRQPSEIELHRAEAITVYPTRLRAWAIFNGPAARFSWGKPLKGHLGRYTVYDTRRHVHVAACPPQADLLTLIALSMTDAPFPIEAVQILLDPIPEYPTPQIVLRQAGRPMLYTPVPWDLKGLGLPVRTIEHQAAQSLQTALQQVERTIPPTTQLEDRWARGQLEVHDTLGTLQDALPHDLDASQYYRGMDRASLTDQ